MRQFLSFKAIILDFSRKLPVTNVDTIVSTYAIHHLTQKEKHALFKEIDELLSQGGQAIFGDLMFLSRHDELLMRKKYPHLEDDFDEEVTALEQLGFAVEFERISDLTCAILARKSTKTSRA